MAAVKSFEEEVRQANRHAFEAKRALRPNAEVSSEEAQKTLARDTRSSNHVKKWRCENQQCRHVNFGFRGLCQRCLGPPPEETAAHQERIRQAGRGSSMASAKLVESNTHTTTEETSGMAEPVTYSLEESIEKETLALQELKYTLWERGRMLREEELAAAEEKWLLEKARKCQQHWEQELAHGRAVFWTILKLDLKLKARSDWERLRMAREEELTWAQTLEELQQSRQMNEAAMEQVMPPRKRNRWTTT